MNDIDRTIEFCASLDARFTSRIQGAAAADLERLEQLVGHALMPEHRAFLERLGENAGGLHLGAVDTCIRGLIAILGGMTGECPPDIELFAVATGENDADLFLQQDGEAVKVFEHFTLYGKNWRSFDAEYVLPVASSIPELLCSSAMRTIKMRKKPLREGYMQLDEEAGALGKLEAKAQELGFQRFWFSTPTLFAAELGSVDLLAVERPGVPLNIEIAGETEDRLDEIAAAFKSVLDLHVWEL